MAFVHHMILKYFHVGNVVLCSYSLKSQGATDQVSVGSHLLTLEGQWEQSQGKEG